MEEQDLNWIKTMLDDLNSSLETDKSSTSAGVVVVSGESTGDTGNIQSIPTVSPSMSSQIDSNIEDPNEAVDSKERDDAATDDETTKECPNDTQDIQSVDNDTMILPITKEDLADNLVDQSKEDSGIENTVPKNSDDENSALNCEVTDKEDLMNSVTGINTGSCDQFENKKSADGIPSETEILGTDDTLSQDQNDKENEKSSESAKQDDSEIPGDISSVNQILPVPGNLASYTTETESLRNDNENNIDKSHASGSLRLEDVCKSSEADSSSNHPDIDIPEHDLCNAEENPSSLENTSKQYIDNKITEKSEKDISITGDAKASKGGNEDNIIKGRSDSISDDKSDNDTTGVVSTSSDKDKCLNQKESETEKELDSNAEISNPEQNKKSDENIEGDKDEKDQRTDTEIEDTNNEVLSSVSSDIPLNEHLQKPGKVAIDLASSNETNNEYTNHEDINSVYERTIDKDEEMESKEIKESNSSLVTTSEVSPSIASKDNNSPEVIPSKVSLADAVIGGNYDNVDTEKSSKPKNNEPDDVVIVDDDQVPSDSANFNKTLSYIPLQPRIVQNFHTTSSQDLHVPNRLPPTHNRQLVINTMKNCGRCGYKTTDSKQYEKHVSGQCAKMIAVVPSSKVPTFSFCNGMYHCSGCSFSTLKRKLFVVHVCLHLVPDPCRCQHCNYSTRNLSDINNHMVRCHPRKTPTWKIAGNELVQSIMNKLGSSAPLSNTTFLPANNLPASSPQNAPLAAPEHIIMNNRGIASGASVDDDDDDGGMGLKIVSVESLKDTVDNDFRAEVVSEFLNQPLNNDMVLSINNSHSEGEVGSTFSKENKQDAKSEGSVNLHVATESVTTEPCSTKSKGQTNFSPLFTDQDLVRSEKTGGSIEPKDTPADTDSSSMKKDLSKNVKCYYKDGYFCCESCDYMIKEDQKQVFRQHLYTDLHLDNTVCGHCHKTRALGDEKMTCPMVDMVMNLLMQSKAAAHKLSADGQEISGLIDLTKAVKCNSDVQVTKDQHVPKITDLEQGMGLLEELERSMGKSEAGSKDSPSIAETNKGVLSNEKKPEAKESIEVKSKADKVAMTPMDTSGNNMNESKGCKQKNSLPDEGKVDNEQKVVTDTIIERKKQVARKGSGPKSAKAAKLNAAKKPSSKVLLKCLYEDGKFQCRSCLYSNTDLRAFNIHVWKDVHRPSMVCNHSAEANSKQCPIVKQMMDMLIKKRNASSTNESNTEGDEGIKSDLLNNASPESFRESESFESTSSIRIPVEENSTSSSIGIAVEENSTIKSCGEDVQKISEVDCLSEKSSETANTTQVLDEQKGKADKDIVNESSDTECKQISSSVTDDQHEPKTTSKSELLTDMPGKKSDGTSLINKNTKRENPAKSPTYQLNMKATKVVNLVHKAVLNVKTSKEHQNKEDTKDSSKSEIKDTTIESSSPVPCRNPEGVKSSISYSGKTALLSSLLDDSISSENNDLVIDLPSTSSSVVSDHESDSNKVIDKQQDRKASDDALVVDLSASAGQPPITQPVKMRSLLSKNVCADKSDASRKGGINVVDSDMVVKDAAESVGKTLTSTKAKRVDVPEKQALNQQNLKQPNKNLRDVLEGYDTSFICSIPSCNVVTSNPTQLRNHMKNGHNSLASYPCVYCSFKSLSVEQYVRHVSLHGQTQLSKRLQLYRCAVPQCSFSTGLPDAFSQHNVKEHPHTTDFRCCYCNQVFSNNDDLMKHLQSNVMRAVLCPYCKVTVKFRFQMLEHLSTVHPNEQKRILVGTRILCKKSNDPQQGSVKIVTSKKETTTSGTDPSSPIIIGESSEPSLNQEAIKQKAKTEEKVAEQNTTKPRETSTLKGDDTSAGLSLSNKSRTPSPMLQNLEQKCLKCGYATSSVEQFLMHASQCSRSSPSLLKATKPDTMLTCPHCSKHLQNQADLLRHSSLCCQRPLKSLLTGPSAKNFIKDSGGRSSPSVSGEVSRKLKLPQQDEVDVTMETAATNLQETLDSGRTSGHARKAKQVPREWGECLFEDEDLNQTHAAKKNRTREYFECPQCPYNALSQKNLQRHLDRHVSPKDGSKRFYCRHCGFGSDVPSAFLHHLVFHREASRLRIYKCPHCAFSTNQMSLIEDHLESKHLSLEFRFEVSQKQIEPRVFSCHVCDESNFGDIQFLWKHMQNKHGAKKVKDFHKDIAKEDNAPSDDDFDATSDTESNVQKVPALPKPSPCLERSESPSEKAAETAGRESLEKGKGRLACKFCNYTNHTMKKFMPHVSSHVEINTSLEIIVYQCKYCHLTSTSNRLIREHNMVTHAGKAPIVISKPLTIYGSKTDAVRIKKTSPAKSASPSVSVQIDRYHCDHCFFSTNSRATLNFHVSTQHSVVTPAVAGNVASKVPEQPVEVAPEIDGWTEQAASEEAAECVREESPERAEEEAEPSSPPVLAPEVSIGSAHMAPFPIRRPGGRRLWKCPYCSHDSCKRYNIDKHIQNVHIHKKIKGFSCVYCQYECNSKFNMAYHQKKYHPNKQMRYKFFDRSLKMEKIPFGATLRSPGSVKKFNKGNLSKLKIRLPEFKKMPPKLNLEVNNQSRKELTSLTEMDVCGHTIRIPDGSLFVVPKKCPVCDFESKVRSDFLTHVKRHIGSTLQSLLTTEKEKSNLTKVHDNRILSEGQQPSADSNNESASDVRDIPANEQVSEENEGSPLVADLANNDSNDDSAEAEDHMSGGEDVESSSVEEEWAPSGEKRRPPTNYDMSLVKLTIDGREAYKCTECDFTARFPSKVKRHIDYKHKHYKHFKCGYCDFDAVEKGKVRRHCSIIHRNLPPKVMFLSQNSDGNQEAGECPTGGDSQADSGDLSAEQSPATSDSGPERNVEGSDLSWLAQCYAKLGKNQLRCNYCSYKQEGASAMRRHVLAVHLDFYPYKCKHCEFVAVEKNKVVKHITLRHPGQPVRIIIRKWKHKLPPFPGQTVGLDADSDDNMEEEFVSPSGDNSEPRRSSSEREQTSPGHAESLDSQEGDCSSPSVNTPQGSSSKPEVTPPAETSTTSTDEMKDTVEVDLSLVKAEPVDDYFKIHPYKSGQTNDTSGDSVERIPVAPKAHETRTNSDKTVKAKTFSLQGTLAKLSERFQSPERYHNMSSDESSKPESPRRKHSTPSRYVDEVASGPLSSPKKLFGCSFCDYTSRYGRQDAMRHIIVNHFRKHPYSCGTCKKGLQKACKIREHWQREHMKFGHAMNLVNNMEMLNLGIVHMEERLEVYGIVTEESQAALQKSQNSSSPVLHGNQNSVQKVKDMTPPGGGTPKSAYSSPARSLSLLKSRTPTPTRTAVVQQSEAEPLNLSSKIKPEPVDFGETLSTVTDEDNESIGGASSYTADRSDCATPTSNSAMSKKIFECTYCGYRSKWCNSDVRKHISMVHLRMFPFKCLYCPYQSMGTIKMRKHWISVHKPQGQEYRYTKQEEAVISQVRETEDTIYFGTDPAAHRTIHQHKRITKIQQSQNLYKDSELTIPQVNKTTTTTNVAPKPTPDAMEMNTENPMQNIKQEPDSGAYEEQLNEAPMKLSDKPRIHTSPVRIMEKSPTAFGKKQGPCRKQFKCVYCGHASKWNMRDVKKHIYSIHVQQYPFQCGHCTKGCIDKVIMEAHWQRKHPLLPFLFKQSVGREVIPLEEEGDVVMLGVPDLLEDEIHMESKKKRKYPPLTNILPPSAKSSPLNLPPTAKRMRTEESLLRTEHVLTRSNEGLPVSHNISNKEDNDEEEGTRSGIVNTPERKDKWKSPVRTTTVASSPNKTVSLQESTVTDDELSDMLNQKIQVAPFENRRVFICKDCGYSNLATYKVRRHILAKHLKLYPFRCKYCSYCSIEKFNIHTHMAKTHPEKDFGLIVSRVYKQLCPSSYASNLGPGEELDDAENIVIRKETITDAPKMDLPKVEPVSDLPEDLSLPKLFEKESPKPESPKVNTLPLSSPHHLRSPDKEKQLPLSSPHNEKKAHTPTVPKNEKKQFPCEFCPYISNDINLLKKHMIRHYTFKPYGCFYCKYRAYETKQVRGHLRTQHNDCEMKIKKFNKPAVFEVRDDFQSNQPSKYQRVMKKKNKNPVPMPQNQRLVLNGVMFYKCGLCPYKTASPKCLKIHSSRAHKKDTSILQPEPVNSEPGNDEEDWTDIKTAAPKTKITIPIPKLKTTASKKLGIDAAQRRATPIVKTSYRCTACGFTFASKGFIAIHVRKHQEYKPFCCGYCSSVHYRRTDAITHINNCHPNQPIYIKVERDIEIERNLHTLIETLKPKAPKLVHHRPASQAAETASTSSNVEDEVGESSDSSQLMQAAEKNKKYPCPLCPFIVNSLEKLKMHIRSEICYKPFHCSACSFRSVDKVQVKKHMKQVHRNEEVHITFNKSLELETKLRKLMTDALKKAREMPNGGPTVTQTSPKGDVVHKYGGFNILPGGSFQCVKCGYITTKRKHMYNHMVRHGPPRFFCGHCEDYFGVYPFEVENHRKQVHPDLPPNTKRSDPSTAPRTLTVTKKVKMQSLHGTSKPENLMPVEEYRRDAEGRYMCDQPSCQYSTSNKRDITRHRLTHMAEPLYRCLHCNYKSNYRFNSRKHLKTFHPKQAQKIQRLTPSGELVVEPINVIYKRAPRIYTSPIKRPPMPTVYCCTQCGFKDTNQDSYVEHLEWHFSEAQSDEMNPLLIPSSAASTGNMEDNAVPLKCGFCPFVSHNEDVFNRHIETHTVSRPFKCGYCDHTGFHRSKIKDHSLRIHVDLPVKIVSCENPLQIYDSASETGSVQGKKASVKINLLPTLVVKDVFKMPVHEYMMLMSTNGVSNYL